MQMDNCIYSGPLMQIVDILGDHRYVPASLRQLAYCVMTGVRLGQGDLAPTPQIPTPHQRGVLSKRVSGFQTLWVMFCPQSSEFVSEGRYAALG